jgi:polyhydroxyalkanoate synthase
MGIPGMDFANFTGQLGVTPKTTIDAQGTLKLHHFTPMCDEVYRVPVLIVTSLVNQPYILAVLWAAIDAAMRGKVSAGPLKSLVCMATPVNSDGLESLKTWMGPDFDEEALLAEHGNVPAEWVQNALRSLRPFGKVAGAANLLNQADQEAIVRSNLRMGKWETDNIPFPGGVFRQMVNDFLRDNCLINGRWKIGAYSADLAAIRVPLLHLLAQDDHITPYPSSRDLVQRVSSSDREEVMIKGGHVGLVAGRGAQMRMWPALEAWLAQRS